MVYGGVLRPQQPSDMLIKVKLLWHYKILLLSYTLPRCLDVFGTFTRLSAPMAHKRKNAGAGISCPSDRKPAYGCSYTYFTVPFLFPDFLSFLKSSLFCFFVSFFAQMHNFFDVFLNAPLLIAFNFPFASTVFSFLQP